MPTEISELDAMALLYALEVVARLQAQLDAAQGKADAAKRSLQARYQLGPQDSVNLHDRQITRTQISDSGT